MARMGAIGLVAGVLLAAGVLALTRGCSPRGEREAGPLRVVASIAPLAGLARELAPEGSEVRTLIPGGASPHGADLTPADISALGNADVVILVGGGFEPAVERALRAARRESRVEWRFLDALSEEQRETPPPVTPTQTPGEADPHDHDHDGEHDHAIDPHVWLDPVLVAEALPSLAEAVKEGVRSAHPDEPGRSHEVDRRLIELRERVSALHRRVLDLLSPHAGKAIITHHSSFDRFARRYGLRIAGVIRPREGVEPTSGDLSRAMRGVREQGARIVLVEPQFEGTGARRVAEETGAVLVEADPIGDGDWFALLERNARAIAAGLEGTGGGEGG